jgi:hypothetical protein
MNRRTIGQVLLALGVVLALVGVIGLVANRAGTPTAAPDGSDTPSDPTATTSSAPPTAPTTEPTVTEPTTEPSGPAGVAFADGTVTDPADDVYTCADGSAAAPQPRVDVVEVTYAPTATNPATGGEASSLLVAVRDAFATDKVGAEAVVLLGTGEVDGQPSADDLHVGAGSLQIRLTYTGPGDPPFTKSARRWEGSAWVDQDASAYNVRFEGFDDHVEFEFFAPPGTTFAAALVTDTEVCDVVTPARG